jgi:hypothetical protein
MLPPVSSLSQGLYWPHMTTTNALVAAAFAGGTAGSFWLSMRLW